MKVVHILLLLSLIISSSFCSDNLDAIMSDIESENDLSKITKQENVGHLIIFTRQELDTLQVTNIKDLMEYINFSGYNENEKGLPDLSFIPDIAKDVAYMKVFIDDQVLFSPLYGNGIQFYGKIDLNFVDHVEMYWGAPSFTFGLGCAYVVIKLYSKNPKRENITSINAYGGSYGTYGVSGFSSKDYGDFSYLLSLSYKQLKNKNMYQHEDYPLKRDQNSLFLYTTFYFNNSRITLNALKSEYDTFLGDSQTYKHTKSEEEYKNFYISYDYLSDDETFKTHLSFYHGRFNTEEEANSLFIYENINNELEYINSYDSSLNETFIDAYISKTFTYENNTLDIGLKSRYRTLDPSSLKLNGIDTHFEYEYDHQFTSSLYLEDKYLINNSNVVSLAASYDRRFNKVKNLNPTDYSIKLGYTHNATSWYAKLFGYYAKNSQTIYNFYNYRNFYGFSPNRQTILSYSGEIGLKPDNYNLSAAYAHFNIKQPSASTPVHADLTSLNFDYRFNSFHHIKSSLWYMRFGANLIFQNQLPEKITTQGAYVILFDTFGDFELANSIIYTKNIIPNDKHYRFNSTINYNVNKKLKFYLKLNNIFNSSPNRSYIATSFNDGQTTIYPSTFPLLDRTVYFGVEYSF